MLFSDGAESYHASAVDGKQKHIRYEARPSDSPFVERIWRTQSHLDDHGIAIADGRWDMMLLTQNGQTNVFITGPQTTAVSIPHAAGAEWLGIRFRLGVTMPNIPLNTLVNEGIQLPDAAFKAFWLQGSAWELPTYENVDTFINRLMKQDLLIADPVVASIVQGETQHWSLRALQYRFQQTIGVSSKTVQQIERAQAAVVALEAGISIADTVFELGYYDQSHLTNSLKRFMGRTPAQIVKKSTVR